MMSESLYMYLRHACSASDAQVKFVMILSRSCGEKSQVAWERGYHLDSPHTTMQQSEKDANPNYSTKSNTGPQQSYQLITFLSAKEAVCPPRTSLTGSLFLWMPLMETEKKSPREVGPSRRTSLTLITPCIHVPDTTVPTPWYQRERHRQIHDNKDTVKTRNCKNGVYFWNWKRAAIQRVNMQLHQYIERSRLLSCMIYNVAVSISQPR